MAAITDVEHIAEFIALDAPLRAAIFVHDLMRSTDMLEQFPAIGRIVPEKNDPGIRELVFAPYRIIYRIKADTVEILHVYHSARLITGSALN